ncbi:MAG: twin-arginine translocase TatA/TatE family subunit [Dehalococcoidia bacterium]|nr:twin-arginine translocase TatA/TatE family subunit [Dehalococcoidia bacterium]
MRGLVGLPELLVILVVVLLLFGATRLPKLAKSLGEAVHEFRKGTEEEQPQQRRKTKAHTKDTSNEA